MNIFELLNDRYFLSDKPKLFEAFSGIGCQLMAFKRLGIEVESVGFSEIDKYAIQSYNAIHCDTKNFGSICDIKGTDLPQIDVFTWSFPCTDLSKAGKQKGLTNTRSGLVYEVLRIMQECKVNGNLPKVLIMENVVDLVQVKFIREFQEIQLELEELGYSNYTQTLNAKDYGVAQNRDRVFMVSILGDYYYEFPKPIKLEKRLKDYLDDEVDEKYYLSDKLLNFFEENSVRNEMNGNGFRFKPKDKEAIANAVTTLAGNRMDDNFIKIPEDTMQSGNREPKVSIMGNVNPSGIGVVEHSGLYLHDSEAFHKDDLPGMSRCLKANKHDAGVNDGLRIRKLTPLECWRLMGIDDDNFHKAKASGVSNSQLYKQAGNGIVVDVFASILSTMKGNV